MFYTDVKTAVDLFIYLFFFDRTWLSVAVWIRTGILLNVTEESREEEIFYDGAIHNAFTAFFSFILELKAS